MRVRDGGCRPSLLRIVMLWAIGLFCVMNSATALATVYTFSGTSFPVCSSWGGWTVSGTTYTCGDAIGLASGDRILPAASISVVANAGITLAGNNTVGSASVAVNLQASYGSGITVSNSGNTFYGNLSTGSSDITVNNASITGSVSSSSGAIKLTNVAVTGSLVTNGSVTLSGGSVSGSVTGTNGLSTTNGTVVGGNVSTNGTLSLSGGSVAGNASGNNGVTTTNGTVIGGDATASSGSVSLSGGSVSGSVHSGCCTVTTSNTDVGNGVSSNSGTVSISGGTIAGAISTSGGSGIIIQNATVSSGSINATNVSIAISNSTIGSGASTVNVTGNNQVTLSNNTVVYGALSAATWPGALTIDSSSTVYGNCTPANARCNAVVAGPDHIRVFLNNSVAALTCAPRAVDAIACANAACSTRYASSVGVTLSPGGTAATIPASGTGTPSIARTAVGAATIALAASVPATVGGTALRCYAGTVAAPGSEVTGAGCAVTFASAGFFVSVPDHVACTTQTLSVTAAKTDDKTQTCVPAFANGASRAINLSFAYANPATGTLVPTVGSASPPTSALATTLAMTFNAGVATTNFRYADAGRLSVSASYSGSAANGDAGLSMSNVSNSGFVVAPASFVISGIPAAPLTAGTPFNITVTASNSCGGTTTNFGQEATPATALLTSANPVPGLGNATAISQSLTGFAKGVASTNLTWNEVGTVDLAAATSAYLGSALSVSGNQAAVGRFKPAYFDTVVTPGCGAFTYAGLSGAPALAGQPFTVQVTARGSDGTVTANYAGATWARAVTLSDANGAAGTLANTTLAAAAFANGQAQRTDVTHAVADKLTAPYALAIRAIEADTAPVSSSGHAEGSTAMRSGRLRLGNAYGSELLDLPLDLRLQYWAGTAQGWLTNAADSCTAVKTSDFAFDFTGAGNPLVACRTVIAIAAAAPRYRLTAPGAGNTGWARVTVNLGASPSGSQCVVVGGAGAAATTLNAPWLQFNWSGALGNPSLLATFGAYKSGPVIHRREMY